MRCPKCDNLMVAEEFIDYRQSGKFNFIGWRCLSCGLILDPVILLHRTDKGHEKRSESPKRVLVGVKKGVS